jgi:hypothetical protein
MTSLYGNVDDEQIEQTIKLLSNPKKVVEGVILFKKLDRGQISKKQKKKNSSAEDFSEGKVIFSLEELPTRVVYATEIGVTVERISDKEVRIGGILISFSVHSEM